MLSFIIVLEYSLIHCLRQKISIYLDLGNVHMILILCKTTFAPLNSQVMNVGNDTQALVDKHVKVAYENWQDLIRECDGERLGVNPLLQGIYTYDAGFLNDLSLRNSNLQA